MKVYIFRCLGRPKMYGATRYETGSNLPTDQCPRGWQFYRRVDLKLKQEIEGFAIDVGTLLHKLQRNGWYVWDESPEDLRRNAREEGRPVSGAQHPPIAKLESAASEVASASRTDMAPMTTAEVAPAHQVAMPMAPKVDVATSAVTLPGRHQVVWFDIPVRDLDRALRFYSNVLGTNLKKEQAGPGVAIAVLPHADGYIGGCLVQNADSMPSGSGPLLYLNTNGRLDEALNAVEKHGGIVLSTRHSIAPFGFRAIVLDSEGNRLALHSM